MAEPTQVDRADAPTEDVTATASGEMPSPKLLREREQAAQKRSRIGWIVLGIVVRGGCGGFFCLALSGHL